MCATRVFKLRHKKLKTSCRVVGFFFYFVSTNTRGVYEMVNKKH